MNELVAALQQLVHRIYDVEVEDVTPFVLTDAGTAEALGAARHTPESLLISEHQGDVRLTLYLDARMLQRLMKRDPRRCLDGDNLDDFCALLEGVSHFVYLAHNARHDRPVTQLEMELQAEIDKFVTSLYLLRRQSGTTAGRGLLGSLFGSVRLRPRLDLIQRRRYQLAHELASRYCEALQGTYLLSGRPGGLVNELRRFYRLLQPQKIRHIESQATA